MSPNAAKPQPKESEYLAQRRKGAKEKEFFEPFGVCWCVMLNPSAKLRVNSVKHLFCASPSFSIGK
jgi:hypothetical protein